jgi:hypothetical protein
VKRWLLKPVTWLSRAVLVVAFVGSTYDLVHYSINPSAYPIPSTEIGDPRYESATRFLWTSGVHGGIAFVGLLLWAGLSARRSSVGAAISSVVTAALLVIEARVVNLVLG